MHPEYRTMPMVWYCPPLSPIMNYFEGQNAGNNPDAIFPAIEEMRLPIQYLAELFTAGDTVAVKGSLQRMAMMRSYMRAQNTGREFDMSRLARVGLTERQAKDMYRLLAIAKHEDRFVIPTSHKEQYMDTYTAQGSQGYGENTLVRTVTVAVYQSEQVEKRVKKCITSVSMEGFSVINLHMLDTYKDTFGYMSQQLSFPEKLTFHPKTFEEVFDETHPAYPHVVAYREAMYEKSLSEIQAFTQTRLILMKSHFVYDIQSTGYTKERGQMLAKLKVLYEMFGLEMPASELSDYLPLMLEFLYAARFDGDTRAQENVQLVIMIIEDGTYAMMKHLESEHNPYAHLIRGLRETFKHCIVQDKEVTHHV